MTLLPVERRSATRLSPDIRHGLLTLSAVWAAVTEAPTRDPWRCSLSSGFLRYGVVVEPSTAKGPIRIRRTRRCGREVDG
jgi:hypothetical protein